MTTASIAVYDDSTKPPSLITVVGVDLLTDDIKAVEPNFQALLSALVARSQSCPNIDVSSNDAKCQRKILRETEYSSASSLFPTAGTTDRTCPADGALACAGHSTTSVCAGGQPTSALGTLGAETFCANPDYDFNTASCEGCSATSNGWRVFGFVVAGLVCFVILALVLRRLRRGSHKGRHSTTETAAPAAVAAPQPVTHAGSGSGWPSAPPAAAPAAQPYPAPAGYPSGYPSGYPPASAPPQAYPPAAPYAATAYPPAAQHPAYPPGTYPPEQPPTYAR